MLKELWYGEVFDVGNGVVLGVGEREWFGMGERVWIGGVLKCGGEVFIDWDNVVVSVEIFGLVVCELGLGRGVKLFEFFLLFSGGEVCVVGGVL